MSASNLSTRAPFVTLAIPCLDEAAYIEDCLRTVLAQDYPPDRIEILVTDGGSTDGTRALVARFAADHPQVILVDNPARVQAAGMNEAIRRARGEIIVRMDVHCQYASDYVRKCVEVLTRTGAANVGGAQRPRARTAFQRAVSAALSSRIGVGGASYRSAEREGFVDTVFLGAFRRSVFEEVGLYDPHAITNEDAELNQRIHAAGGRIYLSREIVVHYFPRDSFQGLAKQYFRYGRGRARTLLKHRKLLSVRPVVPAGVVAAGLVLAVTPPLRPLAASSLALGAAITGLVAARAAWREGVRQVVTVWAIFPVMYVAHGVGFWAGLVHYLRHPDWSAQERLPRRAATERRHRSDASVAP